jgi:hypothetical protein
VNGGDRCGRARRDCARCFSESFCFHGVLFLRDVGFFERRRRFWTNEDFQEEAAIRTRMEARLRATGLNDPNLKDAYDMVREANEEPAMHTK